MIKGHRDSKVVARFIKNETKQNQYLKGVVDGKRLGAVEELMRLELLCKDYDADKYNRITQSTVEDFIYTERKRLRELKSE